MPPNSREVPQPRKSNRIRKKPERYESQHSQEGSRGVGPVAPPPEENNNWFVDYDNHNPDSDDEQVEEGGREQGEEVEGEGEVGVDVEEWARARGAVGQPPKHFGKMPDGLPLR